MPYTCSNAKALAGTAAIGNGQSVALIRRHTHAPAASLWRPGRPVKGDLTIPVGTLIATFVDGCFASLPRGGHAALYVGQDAAGLWVIDQQPGARQVRRRRLPFSGGNASADLLEPGDNGDAFSVVE